MPSGRRSDTGQVSGGEIDARTDATLEVLHGEQGFTYHAMAYAGDTLTFEQRIDDIYDKKGGALEFVVRTTRVTNQRGELCASYEILTLVARRGAT